MESNCALIFDMPSDHDHRHIVDLITQKSMEMDRNASLSECNAIIDPSI